MATYSSMYVCMKMYLLTPKKEMSGDISVTILFSLNCSDALNERYRTKKKFAPGITAQKLIQRYSRVTTSRALLRITAFNRPAWGLCPENVLEIERVRPRT